MSPDEIIFTRAEFDFLYKNVICNNYLKQTVRSIKKEYKKDKKKLQQQMVDKLNKQALEYMKKNK